MALIYADSFDHLDSDRYDALGNDFTFNTGRRGTNGMGFGDTGTARSAGFSLGLDQSFGIGDTLIVGCALNMSDTSGTAWVISNQFNEKRFQLRASGASGWSLYGNGNIVTGGAAITSGAWYYVEGKIYLHNTNGTLELRVNGTTVASNSGIDTYAANIDTLWVGADSGDDAPDGSGNTLEDLVIMDGTGSTMNDFIGDVWVQYLSPTADGTLTQLNGSDGNQVDNYDLVNEASPSASDYTGSTGVGDTDFYSIQTLSTATTWTVYGMQVASLIAKTAGAASYGKLLATVDAAETVVETASIALSTDYIYNLLTLDTQPDNSTWTIAAFNSLETGFKVTSS